MFVLSYDVGTTGVKTCLFEIDERIRAVDTATEGYPIHVLPGGGAEQDPDDWWRAMAVTTRAIAERHPDAVARIEGISFCSQLQALVLVDAEGRHVRRAMSYMDQRAAALMEEVAGGWPRLAGLSAPFVLRSLQLTGAVAASAKDPVWKYRWVARHEPEVMARAHRWLDVKDALISRMTGRCTMSEDSAFATLLYDVRGKARRFHPWMLRRLGVDPAHMPEIVASTDVVGPLLPGPAAELGLPEGIPVFSGGGDSALIGVGAGATDLGDTHVYVGTSGWVSTVTDKVTVDTSSMVAAIVGAIPGRYHYFAELETAGKCLEWVRDHLALDEINIYLAHEDVAEGPDAEFASLYDYLSRVIDSAEPGAGGVLFAPWLHGNRCPFEDSTARGLFLGISLGTGKTELLRAVVEGVCYHLRWFVDTHEQRMRTSSRVRFVGGGGLSPVTAQILADVLGRGVDVVDHPQDVGAVGAALVAATGLGRFATLGEAKSLVDVAASYEPNPAHRAVYDHMYAAFRQLHRSNKAIFRHLATPPAGS